MQHPDPSTTDGLPRRAALAVALGYLAAGALWILLSDRAVEWLWPSADTRALVGTLKGWLFIAVTAALLFSVLHRLMQRIQAHHAEQLRALQLLDSVTSGSDDAIFAKDLQGRYLLFNRAASEFVGKSAADVLGRDDRELFPPEQADMLMAIGRRVVALERTETSEEVLDTPAGRRIFLATKGPLRDSAGRIIGTFGISHDITQRTLAEQALREREQQLAAIIGHSPSALSLKHADGRYAVANPNLQRIHHLSEAEIVGKTDFELYPPETARAFQANDQLVIASRVRHSVEEIVPVDGQMRRFMSHIFPVLAADGSVQSVCRISLDITRSRQAEEALQARNDELERFNRALVGRELDMVRLKQEVNELSRQLGRSAPYDPPTLAPPGPASRPSPP